MLRHRLATAAVVLPLLGLLIFRGPAWMLAAVVAAVAVAGISEYVVMAFPRKRREQAVIVVLGAVFVGGAVSGREEWFAAGLGALVAGGLLWLLVGRRDFEAGLADLGRAFVGVMYSGYFLPHFAWLRELADGSYWVAFLLATAMIGDTAGYCVGRRFGRHRLAPRISPNKTIEGAVSILLADIALGFGAKLSILPQLTWTEAALLGTAQGILGQAGDLCESIIKRTYGVKDSGWIFPGHGGVLDRIDSLVFPAAGVYYYLVLWR